MKRLGAALATVAVAALGTFAVASPAQAEDPVPHYATGVWKLQDWTGLYPNTLPSVALESDASCDAVTLTKVEVPEGPALYGPTSAGDVGTDFSTGNLGLAVDAGDQLVVDYELGDVADTLAGAVRMFVYGMVDANTLIAAPDLSVAVTNPAIAPDGVDTEGELVIEFDGAGIIGTFGLTYDASNDTEDAVVFTNLRLVTGEEEFTPIAFCAKPVVETTTQTCIDLNTASVTELEGIINIGPELAPDVVALRPITSVDELMDIDGIAAVKLAEIKAEHKYCDITPTTTATLPVTGPSASTALIAGGVSLLVGIIVVIAARKRRDQEQPQA